MSKRDTIILFIRKYFNIFTVSLLILTFGFVFETNSFIEPINDYIVVDENKTIDDVLLRTNPIEYRIYPKSVKSDFKQISLISVQDMSNNLLSSTDNGITSEIIGDINISRRNIVKYKASLRTTVTGLPQNCPKISIIAILTDPNNLILSTAGENRFDENKVSVGGSLHLASKSGTYTLFIIGFVTFATPIHETYKYFIGKISIPSNTKMFFYP